MNVKNRLLFWRIVLVAIPICTLAAMVQMAQTAAGLKIQILHSNWKYIFALLSGLAVLALGLLAILWTPWRASFVSWLDRPAARPALVKAAALVVLILLPIIFSTAVLHPYLKKYYFGGFYPKVLLALMLSLVGMFCLKALKDELSWPAALAVSNTLIIGIYRAGLIFTKVNNYPFALGWSEVSRFYGASLFFSQRLYGARFSLPLLHPTWHALLSPLFFFQSPPIWAFRLWQAFLQAALTAGLAYALAKRFKPGSGGIIWLVAGWAFLFFMQGPILVPLLVCAILVTAGVDPQKFWRTTLVVVLASLWAGWSRINWFPVPGVAAAAIYLLEMRLDEPKRWLRYIWKPIVWMTGGTALALAANLVFVRLSGNGSGGNFASSLSSDLLWYRLLPNSTYAHGILLDMLLVSLPLLAVIYLAFFRQRTLHPLRAGGLLAILLVLCAGGLVVSVKIGGGSDLHNLDAYWFLLALTGGTLFFDRGASDSGTGPSYLREHPDARISIAALALVIPMGMTLHLGNSIFTWNETQVEKVFSVTKSEIESVSARGEPVLLISQRQLLTLKMVNAPLVPEYEQDALMEMVMSHNTAYLSRFQADLAAQRFGLIVAEEQNLNHYGRKGYFGEENDRWVQEVSVPMLCYYRLLMDPEISQVSLYIPRATPCK